MRQAEVVGDGLGEVLIYLREHVEVTQLDGFLVALAQLEGESVSQVLLLHIGQGQVEHARLREVVLEGGRVLARDGSFDGLGDVNECALFHRGLGGIAGVERVGFVGGDAGVRALLVHAVAQHVVDRGVGAVDRQLAEVRPAEAADLRVQVGEQAALQQRIIGHVDARYEVARVEGDLFGLFEVVAWVLVQRHGADDLDGGELLGDNLRRVEQVNALKHLVRGVREDLHAHVPLGERAGLNGIGEVAAVEVGVHTRGDLRLLPHLGVHAEARLEVELHQRGLAGFVNEAEGVDAERLHHAVGARDAAVRHVPECVVCRFGVLAHKIPEGVVRALRLRDLAVRVRLGGMDDVGELDGVLDEEHRDVIAHQVPRAFVGVELDGRAAGVAHGIGGAARAQHGGEAPENRGFLALGEQACLGDFRGLAVRSEHTVRSGAAGVDDALGDALVVEVGDLLAEVVVLHKQRTARTCAQRVAGLTQASSLRGGKEFALLSPGVGLARAEVERATGRGVGGGRLLVSLRGGRGRRFGRFGASGGVISRCAGNRIVSHYGVPIPRSLWVPPEGRHTDRHLPPHGVTSPGHAANGSAPSHLPRPRPRRLAWLRLCPPVPSELRFRAQRA